MNKTMYEGGKHSVDSNKICGSSNYENSDESSDSDFDESNVKEVCSICLDEINEEDKYLLEQCNHAFHTDCIVRNIQQGNIGCPCCRKLPLFMTNVEESYDLREDLIDEYNEQEKMKFYKRALEIVKKGRPTKLLIKYIGEYTRYFNQNKEINKYNNEIIKKQKEVDKEIRETYNEEEKEINRISKKYNEIRKKIKKKHKIGRLKDPKIELVNKTFLKVVEYVGYRGVEY